ncbi:MAG: hypothetical protein H7Y07_10165 [Pyrinomonadaceae bacterium]|nr:hypothetical protein [Sphingobacteriaceae bacterium]
MKRVLLPILAGSVLILSSCSTAQLAGQANSNDDVYYTQAKAKVVEAPAVKVQPTEDNQANSKADNSYRTQEELYGGRDYSDRDYDDTYRYGYASRLNRFYYNSSWRTYYDYRYSNGYNPWYTYNYDPFFYDPWNYRRRVSVWVGINSYPRYYDSYYNYGYYGSGYGNGYWGPYSYYNSYPGYYGSGRYYSGGGGVYSRPSNPRPNREAGLQRGERSIDDSQNSGNVGTSGGGRPSRGSSAPNQPIGNGRVSSQPEGYSSPSNDRPSRGASSSEGKPSAKPSETSAQPSAPSRPTRTQETSPTRSEPRVEYSRPERSSPPSSSGSSGGSSSSSGSGGNSSSGSGSSSGSRPSR